MRQVITQKPFLNTPHLLSDEKAKIPFTSGQSVPSITVRARRMYAKYRKFLHSGSLHFEVWHSFRYESLGSEGYHSLFKWYQAFEATHFPDPVGLRETIATWTLGLYPNCLKYAMAIFDVPESIAVTRKLLCASGLSSLSRIQVRRYI